MSVEDGTVVSCVHGGGGACACVCTHTGSQRSQSASSSVTVHLTYFFLIRSLSKTGASHFG